MEKPYREPVQTIEDPLTPSGTTFACTIFLWKLVTFADLLSKSLSVLNNSLVDQIFSSRNFSSGFISYTFYVKNTYLNPKNYTFLPQFNLNPGSNHQFNEKQSKNDVHLRIFSIEIRKKHFFLF